MTMCRLTKLFGKECMKRNSVLNKIKNNLPLLFILPLVSIPLTNLKAAEPTGANSHFLGGMVPVGRWAAVLDTRYRTTTERFNDEGKRESLAAEVDGLTLDSQVVPLLASFGAGASLGDVSLDARLDQRRHDLTIGYGLSKNITIGFSIPYGRNTSSANFDILGGNLASNPFFDPGQPISATNPPVVPIGTFGTTDPVGTAGVQQILTDPIYGYQYKPVKTARTTGYGDPIVGLRWRLFKDEESSLIFTPVLRFGLSEENDPDNLMDVALGDGSDDIRLQLEYLTRLAKNFDTRVRVRHTWQLPDSITTRAYSETEYLVPYSRTEKLDRDLGDVTEAYAELGYSNNNWRWFSGLQILRKKSDDYESPSNQDVSGLEDETTHEEDILSLGFSWSGIQHWRDKKLPFPLSVKAAFNTHISGRNRLDRDDLQFALTAVF